MAHAGNEQPLPLANHDGSEWPPTARPPIVGAIGRPFLVRSIAWLLAKLPLLPKITIGLLIVVTGSLVLWATVKAVVRDVVIVDAISVPKDLESHGYSSAVVTQRILDEVNAIRRIAKTAKQHTELGLEKRADLLSDVRLPTTGLSMQTIVAILRDLFGRDETRIGGEVVRSAAPWASAATHSLLIRTERANVRHANRFDGESLEAQFTPAAIEILMRIDPYVLASYYNERKLWDEMDSTLDHILAKEDDSIRKWALMMRGNRLRDQARFDEAAEYYTRALSLDNRFAVALVNKGNISSDKGDYAAAIKAYEASLSFAPQYAVALRNLGVKLTELGEFGAAVEKLEQARDADPRNPAIHRSLGFVWAKKREHQQAATAYQLAFEIDSTNLDTLTQLGVSLYRLERDSQADNKFKEASRRMPAHNVYNAWGDALARVSRFAEARTHYRLALTSDRNNADAYIRIGRTWLEQQPKNIDEAIEACHGAIRARPDYAAGHEFCGELFTRVGRDTTAREHREKAVELDANNPGYLASLGWTFYVTNEPILGAYKFAKAAGHAPGSASLYRNWGVLHLWSGNPDHSVEMYEKAVSLRPRYASALREHADVLDRLGRNGEARQVRHRAHMAELEEAELSGLTTIMTVPVIALYAP